MMINNVIEYLSELYPHPICELTYNKDYELLIKVVLSAQTTDKRVNEVGSVLFSKYDIYALSNLDINIIKSILYPLGNYNKKSYYVKEISKRLVSDYNGVVPNNREYLESLPGVGRKSANVVLSNLFDEPAIAVDTHVKRVSVRLGIAKCNDSVLVVEQKLMKIIPKHLWSRMHHQMVLFGRYICTSKSPKCRDCKLKKYCNYYKNSI